MTAARSATECLLRSVPFGKYWRSKPLVFSFVPRCQGLCGSSIVRCASPATEADLSAYISASDPDTHLDIVGWLVDDGSVFATDAGFANGTYSIAPIAFDKRGAVDVGVATTLTVADCS